MTPKQVSQDQGKQPIMSIEIPIQPNIYTQVEETTQLNWIYDAISKF